MVYQYNTMGRIHGYIVNDLISMTGITGESLTGEIPTVDAYRMPAGDQLPPYAGETPGYTEELATIMCGNPRAGRVDGGFVMMTDGIGSSWVNHAADKG